MSVLEADITLADIDAFCKSITEAEWYGHSLGLFVSALMNRFCEDEDVLHVTPVRWVLDSGLGSFLERGTLVVHGDVEYDAGADLRGARAKVVVKGNVKSGYGDRLKAGTLVIEGQVSGTGFREMTGGHGIVKGIDPRGNFVSEGIGDRQRGGNLEIHCDVPNAMGLGVGYGQEDRSELRVVGDVHCNVNTNQTGGKTFIEGTVRGEVTIGWGKEGGDTIITGGLEAISEGSRVGRPVLGFMTKGGLIHVIGEVDGTVAHDCWPKARIQIDGNVKGEVGGHGTSGTTVGIIGDVEGRVGIDRIRSDDGRTFYCKVEGNVKGNVGDGQIEITGTVDGDVRPHWAPSRVVVGNGVTGTVGAGMFSGEIHVTGSIGKIGESFGGVVYQNGQDRTRIPMRYRLLRKVFTEFR